MTDNKTKKRVTQKRVTQSIEDKLLGIEPVAETVKIINYEDASKRYRVTNLKYENLTPSIFTGLQIESFIGYKNNQARQALIEGAKEVITVDGNGKDAYKIEVL
jgi:hypothetical protein